MQKFFRAIRKMNSIVEAGGELYIRGAGYRGRLVSWELQTMGYTITAFLDKNATRIESVDGIPVLEPDSLIGKIRGTFFVLIAIDSEQIYRKIELELQNFGLLPVEDYCDFSVNPDQRMCKFDDIMPIGDFYKCSVKQANDRMRELALSGICEGDFYNVIGNLDVPLTTACSLKCTYCSHCMPYAMPPKQFDYHKIICDLEKIMSNGYIACLALMGGEPFLYKDLIPFMEAYLKLEGLKSVGFTRVVTNATVAPNDAFYDVFSKLDKKQIYISNYGSASKCLDEMVAKCSDYDIPVYVCQEDSSWTTMGEFEQKRDYSLKQVEHLYSVCSARECTQLYDGKLFNCPRLPVLYDYGHIEDAESDYLNVRDIKQADFSEALHKYLYDKKYLEGCYYCDGQHEYSRKVPKGEV